MGVDPDRIVAITGTVPLIASAINGTVPVIAVPVIGYMS